MLHPTVNGPAIHAEAIIDRIHTIASLMFMQRLNLSVRIDDNRLPGIGWVMLSQIEKNLTKKSTVKGSVPLKLHLNKNNRESVVCLVLTQ